MNSATSRFACGLLAAFAMTAVQPASADNPAKAGTSSGQPLNISIDSPTAGQTVGAGQVVVSGRVALGTLYSSTAVHYISTAYFGNGGCTGDTRRDSQAPLTPGVYFGRTPSCDVQDILGFYRKLSSMAEVQVGYSGSDVDPSAAGIQLLTGAADDRDGDGVLDIEQAMLVQRGALGVLPSLGGVLRSVNEAFAGLPADRQRLSFFVAAVDSYQECEGRNNPYGLSQRDCVLRQPELAKAVAAGIRINTYPSGDSCNPSRAPAVIAEETGGRCTPVPYTSRLSDVLRQSAPVGLRKVDIRIDDGPIQPATLDTAGNFTVLLPAAAGLHEIAATVTAEDGSTATAVIRTLLVETAAQPFAFDARDAVPPGRLAESNEVEVRGVAVPVVASIDTGEYRVNGGAYRSAPSLVQAGDRIQLRLQPSNFNGAEAAMTLRMGTMTGRFAVTTRFDDSLDALYFPSKRDVPGGVYICSDVLTITGIDVMIPYLGNLSNNRQQNYYARQTLINGDQVCACLISSAKAGETRSSEVSAGGLTARFEVTTIVDATPDPFDFADQTVPLLDVAEPRTATITVKGINVPVPISISGGRYAAYSINGGPFGTTAAQVRNGDTVSLRNRLPLLDKSLRVASEEMTVSIGGVSDAWALRLKLLP